MSILLIRHGETDLNATRVVQYPDTPLGATGLVQAEALGRRLASRNIGCILCSDYRRAHMTAEQVARHTSADLFVVEALRERHFGDLRGQSYDSLGDVDIFARDYHPPGGESWAQFDRRVDSAWQKILSYVDNCDADVAVVTHGLVLRSLFERTLDMNEFEVEDELVVANTSVTEVTRTPPWRVGLLACVEHLSNGARSGGAV